MNNTNNTAIDQEKLPIKTPAELKTAIKYLYQTLGELSGRSLETIPLVRYIRLDNITADDVKNQYRKLKDDGNAVLDLKGPVDVDFDYLAQEERRKFSKRLPYYKIKFKKTTEEQPLINIQLRLSDGSYDDLPKVLRGAHYLANSFVNETQENSQAKSLEELYDIMDNLGHKDQFIALINKLYIDALWSTSRKQLNGK